MRRVRIGQQTDHKTLVVFEPDKAAWYRRLYRWLVTIYRQLTQPTTWAQGAPLPRRDAVVGWWLLVAVAVLVMVTVVVGVAQVCGR